MKHPRRKKSAKISEAVFRGRKGFYNFEVYPLTAEIVDSPAVFIFSRRQTDKFGSGHHATICIGETNSILAEIKRHRRARCVKRTAANVVCVLKEISESARDSVIDDLTAARTFSCVRNADEPNIKPRPPIISASPRRVYAPVPKEEAESVESVGSVVPKRTRVSKPESGKKGKSARATTPKARKSGRSPASPKRSTEKSARAETARKAATVAAAKVAKPKSRGIAAAATSARRTVAARSTAPKSKPAATAKPKAAEGKRKPAKAGTRVQGGVDRDRGQHRLPKPERPARRRAKTGAAGKSRSRQKAAA